MLAEVSTHSRPKAAGERYRKSPVDTDCFNTQPPEGGWTIKINDDNTLTIVSTHSRPKAAGKVIQEEAGWRVVSTHSRPKAAGTFILTGRFNIGRVSTHSRPKAAGRLSGGDVVLSECFNTQPPEGGWKSDSGRGRLACCFNTQPPEGGWLGIPSPVTDFDVMFQHTAARRRLALALRRFAAVCTVSTHSRPKAAGAFAVGLYRQQFGFNTQPPEGGWEKIPEGHTINDMFQHTAARRRLGPPADVPKNRMAGFNTQPPEGGWN